MLVVAPCSFGPAAGALFGQPRGFASCPGVSLTGKRGTALLPFGEECHVGLSLVGFAFGHRGEFRGLSGFVERGGPVQEGVVAEMPGKQGAQECNRSRRTVGYTPAGSEPVTDQLGEVAGIPTGGRGCGQHRRPAVGGIPLTPAGCSRGGAPLSCQPEPVLVWSSAARSAVPGALCAPAGSKCSLTTSGFCGEVRPSQVG